MAKCHRFGGGSRRWPAISAAALRRSILEPLACGASCSYRRHRRRKKRDPLPSKSPEANQRFGSDRLSELLKLDMSDSDSDSDLPESESEPEPETKRKIEAFEAMQSTVKSLQLDCCGHRRDAATEIRKLAKDNADARATLAMLGAIPPLISMIDDDDLDSQIAALYALLNLGIGNDLNKAAIVEAGAVDKMLSLLRSDEVRIAEAIVANFLGLSALDLNKPIIGSSDGAIPFLISSFRFPTSPQSQSDALRAVFNLSISLPNVPLLVAADLVPHLLSSVHDMTLSDRILAVVANLVACGAGRRAVARSGEALPILIDVLNWSDAPGCQETAAYVLMVIAHRSEAADRAAMVELGIKSALLELALMGSALAQKRAARVLEVLTTAERGKNQLSEGFVGMPAVSAPLTEEAAMSEERRAVRELVNESLQSNLKRIVRRANNYAVRDFGPSDRAGIKGRLTVTTASSKSLPF